MKNHHFYFWSNIELTEYYNSDIIPVNTRSIKSQYTEKSLNNNSYNSETKTGISFALGLIVTLIILGGAQLYNSVKAAPASPHKRDFIFQLKLNRSFQSIPTKQRLNYHNIDLETLTAKNAIAKGKF